jgi:hypothetical protein
MLAASVDDEQVRLLIHKAAEELRETDTINLQVETELAEVKSQAKMIFRRLNRNSEPQASIESGQYTLQYANGPYMAPRAAQHSADMGQLLSPRLDLFPLHLFEVIP